MAFNSLLNNMELIKRVYLNATNGHRTQEVTKEEFLHSAQMMSQITPLEVDILYSLCDMIHHTNGSVYLFFFTHCNIDDFIIKNVCKLHQEKVNNTTITYWRGRYRVYVDNECDWCVTHSHVTLTKRV